MGVRGVDPQFSRKSTCIVSHLYMRFLLTHSSTFTGSTNQESCNSVVFTIFKNLHISGPTQFNLILFKGQLYKYDDSFSIMLTRTSVLLKYKKYIQFKVCNVVFTFRYSLSKDIFPTYIFVSIYWFKI